MDWHRARVPGEGALLEYGISVFGLLLYINGAVPSSVWRAAVWSVWSCVNMEYDCMNM